MKKEDIGPEELARAACRRRRQAIEAISGIRHEDVDFAFLSQTMGQRVPSPPAGTRGGPPTERVTPAEIRVIEEAIRRTRKSGGIPARGVLLLCMLPTLISMAMALLFWLYVW